MKSLINFFRGMGTSKSSSPAWEKSHPQHQYFCLMKCEGDKTYGTPINCPECNMKLVTANDIKEPIVDFRCNL
ncbi:hypothetical protein [Sunxiuqinia indica]|uniref:hypothetical protein n=1 Tax=Sunxiuqinia indica TaxID=2692584 RepID=UPI001356FEB9|nr:hypothetical protein [Sunxiuqinia indica]